MRPKIAGALRRHDATKVVFRAGGAPADARQQEEHRMRTCPKCSLVNPDSAIVCDCGHVIDTDAARSLPAAALRPPSEPPRPKGREPGLAAKILIGCCGYLFAGVLFAAISAALAPAIRFPTGMSAMAGIAGAVLALRPLGSEDARGGGRRPETRRRNYVSRHWRGELSLGVSYWVNGWLLAFVSICTTAVGIELGHHSENPYAPFSFGVASWILTAVGEVWYFVGTWRSADRPTPGGWISSWAGLAKAGLVIGATLSVAFAVASGWPVLRSALEQARAASASSGGSPPTTAGELKQ
jgi:hypothetical protein